MINFEQLRNAEYLDFNENGVSGSISNSYPWCMTLETDNAYFNMVVDEDTRTVSYFIDYVDEMDKDEDYEGEEITRVQFVRKIKKYFSEDQVQFILDLIKDTKKFMKTFYKEVTA